MPSLRIKVRLGRSAPVARRWFSARLRFAILTDRVGLERYFDSVVLLRAASREEALPRALNAGREREQDYRNEDGVRVRWRLASIVSLDDVAATAHDLNGAEVLAMTSDPTPDDRGLSFDHEFQPERSVPAETC